ncbi:hypothetical protein [Altibacter sp.]|uniref:hypothetical protein n=1 Tax=Altibacter sp. TaxID=2024823 RepID=UPI000C907CAD|nr:hypothetical protein [Altibacter sp.]MAP54904.1 hypothetical protein [Altibacter sp.]
MIFFILLVLIVLNLAGIIMAIRAKKKQFRLTIIVSLVLLNIVSVLSLFYIIILFGGGEW